MAPQRKKVCHLKLLKSKPLCLFFLEQTELSMNLGIFLGRLHVFVQESSGFSFSNFFSYDVSSDELICLLIWGRIIKLLAKRTSALNFARMQISNFTHSTLSTVLCAIYHDEMDNMQQATTNVLIRIWIVPKHLWPQKVAIFASHRK